MRISRTTRGLNRAAPSGNNKIGIFRSKLLRWYAQHGRMFSWRLPTATLFEQILSEVLLQRTTAKAVAEFLPDFLQRFASWEAIASAPELYLGNYLRPIGLWRRRAASLQRLSSEMVRRSGRLPETREEAEDLPGVGQYIASAMLMFGHGRPEPLLDTNMARVLERYFGPRMLADIRYDPYLQELARSVVAGEETKEVNWAVLDLGALICRPRNPRCAHCPLSETCRTGRVALGREQQDPV